MKYLEHKGYTGSIEYSVDENLLYGKVLGIKSLISYEGVTGQDLENDFKNAITDYLLVCKEQGIEIEKPFKGNFNVRLPTKLHQKAALFAMETKTSLNNLVVESIRSRLLKEAL